MPGVRILTQLTKSGKGVAVCPGRDTPFVALSSNLEPRSSDFLAWTEPGMETLVLLVEYVKNERAYLEALRPETFSWSSWEKAIFDFADESVIALEVRTHAMLTDLQVPTDRLQ